MSSEQRKESNWRDYETMEAAALRLIGVLDERAKKRKTLAGSDLGPAQIQRSSMSLLEKAAGKTLEGSSSVNRQPQHTAGGVGGSDHTAERGRNSGGLEWK